MSRRPVCYLTCALIAAAAWLALRNAPTTAQTPPVTDVEKRLKALEDKLAQLLAAREPRTPEGTTAKILADAADRLRAECVAKEKQLADWLAQNPVAPGRSYEEAIKAYSERLSKIESRRAEVLLEKAELEEKLSRIEKALKEGGKPAAMEKIATSGLDALVHNVHGKYEEELLKLQLQKKKSALTHAPDHPVMKELDEMIELFRQFSGKADRGEKGDDAPAKVMRAIKDRIDGLEIMLRTLDHMVETDRAVARGFAEKLEREKSLSADLHRARRALVAVQAAMLDLDAPAK